MGSLNACNVRITRLSLQLSSFYKNDLSTLENLLSLLFTERSKDNRRVEPYFMRSAYFLSRRSSCTLSMYFSVLVTYQTKRKDLRNVLRRQKPQILGKASAAFPGALGNI